MTDALGNEVIVGNWYGYSALGGGYSHTTVGQVKSINEKTGKVRLQNCIVKHYLYGEATTAFWQTNSGRPADVSIRATMIFPVPEQK